MRLLVTGENSDGKACFVSDENLPETPLCEARVRACMLWGRDSVMTLPDAGRRPTLTAALPPPGGCRFSTLTIEAGANGDYHAFIVAALGVHAEPDAPGFHKTPTLDCIYVIAGEFTLEVDAGQTRILAAGDSAVLNGTRHRWHNHSDAAAILLAVMIGARSVAISS